MNLKEIPIDNLREEIIKKNAEESYFNIFLIVLSTLIRRIISYLSSKFLYLLIKNHKKSRPVIGFSNIYYNGNTRAVFEYMLKQEDKYEIFWVANHLKTIRDVKRSGGKAFFIDGLFGIPYFLRADIWVIAHKGRDIPFLPHKNYKIIQLWHGISPKGSNHPKEDFEIYDVWCLPSKYIKQRFIQLWGAPENKLYVTGFPRMDRLYNYLEEPREKLLNETEIKKAKKIILYAPTFDIGLWSWGNEYEEFEKLCKFCYEENLTLILRLHPYTKVDKLRIEKIIEKYKNVYWLDMPKEPDTMKLLAITDILITDWSSIYTDYFLTGRPIIYLEAKKELITEMRGKPKIPSTFRAGEIVLNNNDFYEALKIVLRTGNRFEGKQKELLETIHGKVDGKYAERVVDVVERLI